LTDVSAMNDHDSVTADALDSYLDKIQNLPPTPTLMIKLIELFRQADSDVDEVVKLMRRDPALSAEVLRRCNLSIFGDEEPVKDINDALFRLGFYEVYRLAVSLFGMQALTLTKELKDFPAEALRRHSGITAIAAGLLAKEVGESEGIAFTVGLLHDVGKVALAAAEGPRYSALLQACGQSGALLSSSEKTVFGFNHGEIGARLLIRWGVPDEISIPVSGHHHAEWSGSYERLVTVVDLANLLAHQLQKNLAPKFQELPAVQEAMHMLGLEPEQIFVVQHQLRKTVAQLPSLLATA